eukprot:COSAG02_NODE_56146_length_287_cov_0.484043_1_plen_75_part_01
MQSSWWPELLDHAIRLCKLNASVGLSARDTISFVPVMHEGGIVKFAAKDEAHFFKQKTAYEISECDWSSDVCSSD